MWSCSTSSTVASSGRLTVLEMAPEMNGWTAAIIRTWPEWWIVLSPIEQANTGDVLGGQVRGAEDRLVLVDVGDDLGVLLGRVAEAGAGHGAPSG